MSVGGRIHLGAVLAGAMALAAGTLCAGAARGQALPPAGAIGLVTGAKESTAAAAPAPQPAAPEPAPRAVNDLHPRPLGVPREQGFGHAGTKAGGAAGGKPPASTAAAAATLWDNPLVRTGGSLCIVLAVIFGLAALAKKLSAKNGGLAAALGGRRGPAGIIEVLGRYPLARGQTLILLKVDQRVLLVAQTAGRLRGGAGTLSTLCELTGPEEVASILLKVQEAEGDSTHARFRSLMDRFEKGDAGGGDDGVVEVGLRTRTAGEGGDAAELWDDRPAVVHRFPVVQPTAVRPAHAPHAGAEAPVGVPPAHAHAAYAAGASTGHLAQTGTDSYSSIRERLHALRGEAHR
jgi:flagellar biogenesis protein FliO